MLSFHKCKFKLKFTKIVLVKHLSWSGTFGKNFKLIKKIKQVFPFAQL